MITKSVFLIMYLWHTAGSGQSSIGGPAMTVAQMPSLTVCEKVGAVAEACRSASCASKLLVEPSLRTRRVPLHRSRRCRTAAAASEV